ncbi:tetratricopeptide repeat protein [Salinibacterium sp. NSLL150]|uniref:tetratricopeptide repeat protein n=1 Tax=unclassified Salinibacterium TaxID=2632331 RepID=UPI0018CF92F9|nr:MULTISPECIES: tetratricopeptide repeat protein [unclassified Salinibacterium]MBH0098804.1 tetratricopeptide repeat protein [Salinibacterium sp. NSLL35]MBH0101559.1 tetratricopeptide repeat protein [Salinibacterium sp. NSLL150]MBH0104318.1 tetratricopeptide repeat protein [Salinibacterium sp. NSLL16]MBH0107079.1 tetratricopeptide repeat protein [Salinibacterium sp. NSLL17]
MQQTWRDRIADIWAHAATMAEGDVVAAIDELVAERALDDAEALFEAAGARDYAGRETEAEPLYRSALNNGLDAALRPRAVIQLASTLRNLNRVDESIALLEQQLHEHPDDEWTGPTAAFLALALTTRGDPTLGASVALMALANYLPIYQRSVRGYAAELVAE